ncbi:MAG TPA: T9SS type A sorting domain-containing protein, partial [Flavisolibacter sp.]|nr:T9SS type A sorting domain-containing protein [Flavisolibacter sp.]
ILYTGTWVKKGFTILTGPAQTSFTLKVFNNAPGGGGNDWALDDISVATCSPNLAFTPSNNPTVCSGNVADIGAYIRSYFDNYTYYKWQKSINNGLTWVDAGPVNIGTPTWNGSAYEYYTAYPSFITNPSDSGTKFRVVVSSTLSNITNSSCSFADVASVLTLNVINCGPVLAADILSFSGKIENNSVKLNWTTSREEMPVHFAIEQSADGRNFTVAGTVNGHNNKDEVNHYTWSAPSIQNQAPFYRIRLIATDKQKISKTIKLSVVRTDAVEFTNVPNPFTSQLVAEISVPTSQLVYLQLIDNYGKILFRKQFATNAGHNRLIINDTETLAKGLYTLQLQAGSRVINKKVLKQ